MRIELDDLDLERLGEAIAAYLSPPLDMEALTLKQLSEETNESVKSLRAACLMFENGNPNGLRCRRDTPGVSNSPLKIKRTWFLAWQEKQADLTQLKLHRLGKVA